MSTPTCRICGCTEVDCRGCVERTGESCHWATSDLCSACTGETLISLERARQIEDEGYDATHDDAHNGGELAIAAACYLKAPSKRGPVQRRTPKNWPWEPKWWKPSPNRIRDLVRAGALYLAERDRLQRAKDKRGANAAAGKAKGVAAAIDLYALTPRGSRWLKQIISAARKSAMGASS